ncbi:MAG: SAM-dependent methyltransferase [Planctomycetes bacterium]|nr:SAM-dependent methyltransferase [Planctomycetota bacterium]
MEKAEEYGATAVFFEAGRDGRPPIAQAFVYVSDGPVKDPDFALRHKRLWSWGGVPLVYRVTPGLAQLFRCAHKPDFESKGEIVFKPFKRLRLLAQIASDPWWDAERLRNGTLWDDPKVCKKLLSGRLAAQKTLIAEVKRLYEEISRQRVLPAHLRRKLLVLSLLIAYLEERRVLDDAYFDQFLDGASKFFEVLADGPALVNLLDDLEERFNGRVFALSKEDRETLRGSRQLSLFARLVEGKQEPGGQRTLWERYSFADLPIELISHIYQLFVTDASQAVYTPPFLVRLMLGEVLSWDRLDRLQESWDRPDRPQETGQVILDPCCGSGVFLVEAYKRLVLHWRHRHGWVRPDIFTLRNLLDRVRGMDIEEGAVELAAFSLCLALCDALKPDEIRKSVKLFPELQGKTIRSGCFFKAREDGTVPQIVGVVIGNPPFTSSLGTEGAKRAYDRYQEEHGELPDKQLSYLFLHESMEALAAGGVLSMLQQYGFLYNQQSLGFRRRFIERWDVREILDFISVRGLFHKGGADTKVVVVVAEASQPPPDRQILHATFRRSGRADAEQGFDIDYYDLHWLPRQLALTDDGVWRSDLLGGGRVLDFVKRLKKLTTLGEYAANQGWPTPGEGFFEGASGVSRPADHIIGKPLLPSEAIGEDGIDPSAITIAPHKPIERPRSERRFTPPMLLVREHFDLHHGVWTKGYLTYRNKVVGICGEPSETPLVLDIGAWLRRERTALRAFVAATSVRLFTQKATSVSQVDVLSLPYPESRSLALSPHEQILVADIVDYYRDLIRLGEDSPAMREPGISALSAFNEVYLRQVNAVYRKNRLRALEAQTWPGVVCQPFVFGKGKVDWSGAEELRGKLDALLREKRGGGLTVTRIARIYDGAFIFLLKPNRLRYWLRSIALRDADETMADLWDQGF